MASRMGWPDLGVSFKVEQSTNHDEVTTSTLLPYKIESGGAGGLPLGWSLWLYNASDASKVNLTTQDGRFSVSLKDGQTAIIHEYYGAYIDVPAKAGHRYIASIQARTMEGKAFANRRLALETPGQSSSNRPSQSDWETVSMTTPYYAAGGNLRIIMSAYWDVYVSSFQTVTNWGVQFQNFKLLEQAESGAPIEWTELTCDVQSIAARFGRERYTGRYDVASAGVGLRNDQGAFTYTEGAESSTAMRPGRHVRITATYPGNATPVPVYYGIVDSVADAYSIDGHAVSKLDLVDVSTLLANSTVATSSYSESTGVNSGLRVEQLIAQVGYQRFVRDLGRYTMQAILANGRTVRDECGLVGDSEGAHFFADRAGNLAFKNRDWTDLDRTTDVLNKYVSCNLLAMREPPTGQVPPIDLIPDNPAGVIQICVNALDVDWSRDRVINRLQLSNAGGNAKSYEDFDSQRLYGPFEYSRLDFLNLKSSYTELDARANDLMTGWTTPKLRVNRVTFRPRTLQEAAWAFNVWFGALVRVWYQHPTENWGYAIVTRVQAVEFAISSTEWEVSLTLDQPVSFAEFTELHDMGWDIVKWDEGMWDSTSEVGGTTFWNAGNTWNGATSTWQMEDV